MMYSLTPVRIEIIDFYEDGENTRHYHFRLLEVTSTWLKAQSGQFFMLCVPGVGEAPFTFTALPDENGNFRALVRMMGGVTQALFEQKIGDVLGARGPFGQGWPVNELADKKVLIIGGGCGIAPLVSITEQLIEQGNFDQLAVVYATRSKNTLMLTPERDRWQHLIPIFNVVEDASDLEPLDYYPGTAVSILPKVLETFAELPERVLISGPELMMCAVIEYLVACGIDAHAIYLSLERRMHCAVGLCGHCYVKNQYVCTRGPTFSWTDARALLSPLE
ncbi:iron-sulfur cluster-binding protein [Vibrio alfacsensis]|uniref:iron-sulfur cluster-binding protein n=1 Tax=Vibrio alfacsensis TaxID=1074311 RepID=UPI0040683AF2